MTNLVTRDDIFHAKAVAPDMEGDYWQTFADALNARLAARTPDAATVERLRAALADEPRNVSRIAMEVGRDCRCRRGGEDYKIARTILADIRAALSSATSARGE